MYIYIDIYMSIYGYVYIYVIAFDIHIFIFIYINCKCIYMYIYSCKFVDSSEKLGVRLSLGVSNPGFQPSGPPLTALPPLDFRRSWKKRKDLTEFESQC